MVGNPFLSSMGRSQSHVIVEVLAPVPFLPGIALSPWITFLYGRPRQKSRSHFGPPSLIVLFDWAHAFLHSLGLHPIALLQPHTTPHRLSCFGARPSLTSPPRRTRRLPRPSLPEVLPSAPRSGLYGPGRITLNYGSTSKISAVGDH